MSNQVETNVIKPNLSIFLNEKEHRIIEITSELALDQKINEVESFMKQHNGKGQSDEIKDNLYADAKMLWGQYAKMLKETTYTFFLNRKQHQFLTELLGHKLEYDVNTVFLAIELTDMIGKWVKEGSTQKNDVDLKGYIVDATEITYVYHLIATYKPKGLTHSTYLFAEILRRIGEVSKIVAYYDTHAKNLSKEIQDWVASFEDVPVEAIEKTETKKKLKNQEA